MIERYESILGSDENKNKSKVRMVGNNSKSKLPAKEQVSETMAVPDNLNATLKPLMSRLERLENNGFYTRAEVLDCQVNFLIESVSTVSIVSKAIFDAMMPEQNLEPVTMSISDFSGR